MKKILLTGYFGMGNLGDEAILEGELNYLRTKLPEVEIAVLSGNPQRTSEIFHCPSYQRTALKQVISAIARCDLLILGGGGLLQDVTSFRSLLYYLSLLEFARFRNKKTAVFAVGIGPLKRKISRRLVASSLRGADDVSLRDRESLNWAKEVGIAKAYLSADASLLLPPPPLRERRKEIGIALRPWEGFKSDLVEELLKMVKRRGFSLSYLVFNPNDSSLSLSLAQKTGGNLLEPQSPEEALDILARLEGTIAMRLHSGILSAIVGTPFLALSYDPKVEAIARELGQPSLPLETSRERMLEAFENWLTGKESLQSLLQRGCLEMRERLDKALERIRILIDGGGFSSK